MRRTAGQSLKEILLNSRQKLLTCRHIGKHPEFLTPRVLLHLLAFQNISCMRTKYDLVVRLLRTINLDESVTCSMQSGRNDIFGGGE
jgi:hypothetical protein